MPKSLQISQKDLRDLLHYDSETGVFTWKVAESNSIKVGDIAGSANGTATWYIWVRNYQYAAHDLALFYLFGVVPDIVDHKNGNRLDNRLANLRSATRAQNRHNAKVNSNSQSGSKGVRWRQTASAWQARIQVQGKPISLGHFKTKEEAIIAYAEAAKKYYGEYASTGQYNTPPTPEAPAHTA